jgi:hypothetical protein
MRSDNLTEQQRNAITTITARHVMTQKKTKMQIVKEMQTSAHITKSLAIAIYNRLFS